MMQNVREPTIYERGNGRWVVYYTTSDGERHRHQVKSRRDALGRLENIKKQLADGSILSKEILPVRELMARHIISCPNTKVASVRHRFVKFCDHLGAWDVRRVTTDDLKHWLETELTPKTKGALCGHEDFSAKTLKKNRDHLNHFFSWCAEMNYIRSNPCIGLQYKEEHDDRRGPKVYFDATELNVILPKIQEFSPEYLYPVCMVQLHTGSHLWETTFLEWSDVDFATQRIRYRKTKSGRTRYVKMSKKFAEWNSSMPRTNNWVFVGKRNERLTEDAVKNLGNRFRKFFPHHEQHGDQKKLGSHALRHSFAYNFLQRGWSMYELQAIFCHKSIDTTIRIYGHFKPEQVESPSPFDDF